MPVKLAHTPADLRGNSTVSMTSSTVPELGNMGAS
jgi:hypothetical protein